MRHNRGIPTEEVLAEMRNSEPPIYYLVGTPVRSQPISGNGIHDVRAHWEEILRLATSIKQVWVDKVITPTRRCIQNRHLPFLATVLEPVLKLLGDIAQTVSRDSLSLARH